MDAPLLWPLPEPLALIGRGLMVHATTPRPPVGLTPHMIVHRQNKLVVRHYPARGEGASSTPVVVVPSLINRAYICDLEPDRSLCGGLAEKGHPVYLIDWGVPGPEDAGLDMGGVLLNLLHRSMDRICRHAGTPAAHVFGYCQGGTLAAMYAALRPSRVATLAALNAPVRFAAAGRFRAFVDPAWFDVEQAIDADGLVSTDLMAVAFRMLDPMGNWTKYRGIAEASRDPRSLRRALARERWLEENVPMPGAFAREFIRNAYQEDRLLAGTWIVRGEPVLLRNITAPVLAAVCVRDAIAPAAACRPLLDVVGSQVRELQELEAGHIGVVVGSAGPRHFYPMLDRWFRSHEPGEAT